MSLKREKMSNVDTAWWQMERPTNLMMITAVMTFENPLSYDQVREVIEKRLLRFDRFRQRVVESRRPLVAVNWELDPHFDVAAHIHRVGLPEPGDKAALEEMVSNLMSIPLDYSKPLWQYHLIENYGTGSALIGRLHHCIADGIALMRVLLSLTDDTADAVWFEEETVDNGRPRRGLFSRLTSPAAAVVKTTRRATGAIVHETVETVQHPGRVWNATKFGASGAARLGKVTLRRPDPQTLFNGELGTIKRSAWSEPISLAGVKQVGKLLGGTVNDVMVTAVSGALRRYIDNRGDDSQGLHFRAYIPVNLRPLTGPIKLGNQFGLVFLSLPIGTVDQIERFTEVKRNMDELKNSPEAVVAMGMLYAGGLVTKNVQAAAFDFYHTKATAVMTNVPGPQVPIYLAGSRMKSIMAWVPQSGELSLGISIISYDGDIKVGINTDAGLVPDPRRIVDFLEVEIADMLALLENVEDEEEE